MLISECHCVLHIGLTQCSDFSLYCLQMSLYEDLVAAWVPTKHDWLKKRPLGEELVNKLGKQQMFSYCDRMS